MIAILFSVSTDDLDGIDFFDLEQGIPTYGYELSQAVNDGYLVDFLSVETKLKFIEEGIVYADLSDEDKSIYENTFETEDGYLPESISSSALNEWIFNSDTIRKVLDTFMKNGIRIDYGQKIGKSIIFAKNHAHAEKILEIFNKEYPHLTGYAQVIDNRIKFAQRIIDDFRRPYEFSITNSAQITETIENHIFRQQKRRISAAFVYSGLVGIFL